MLSNFHERKARRTADYFRWRYGRVLETCTACNGSGYYDDYDFINNKPYYCGGCNGKQKERVRGFKAQELDLQREENLKVLKRLEERLAHSLEFLSELSESEKRRIKFVMVWEQEVKSLRKKIALYKRRLLFLGEFVP